MIEARKSIEGIDLEWMQLMLEAKNLGIDKEDVRKFLQNNGIKEIVMENQ